MVESEISERERRIGRQIAEIRGSMSQAAVAEAMRARGHEKWSQSTVWSIEKGTRPLRFTEAQDLANVLDVGIMLLLASEDELGMHIRYEEARYAWREISRQTVAYLEAVWRMQVHIEDAKKRGVSLRTWYRPELVAEGGEVRPTRPRPRPGDTPEDAVKLGREEFERRPAKYGGKGNGGDESDG